MPTISAGGRRCASGVKSTTSAKRMEAAVEVVGDRLGGGLQSLGDRARQDVQEEGLGLLLLGSERRQRRVALVGERGEEREGDGGGPMTFNASIVLVNHTGRSASGKNTSPAMPVSRKTTTKATNQRTA